MIDSSRSLITPTPLAPAHFWRTLRDLPSGITLSTVTAGFIFVLINYTGPLLLVLAAASAGSLTPEQTASWVWAVVVGNGVLCIVQSLAFRMPITAPFSTAGVALLIVSLPSYTLNEAVGAYIVCAGTVALLGISGAFGRLMRLIPQPVIMAVLAGVLLRFGLNIFNTIDDAPGNVWMVAAMVVAFFALKRLRFSAPALGAIAVGLLIAALQGRLEFPAVTMGLALPTWYMPVFTLDALFGLALPLLVMALSSQYAPGQAVLIANGYDAPINRILTLTGVTSMVTALFGGHGNTLGALSAAILVGPDAHPDPDKRYAAGVMGGVWHIAFGLFGAAVVDLFTTFPAVFVSTVAGLSLSGVLSSSLATALAQPATRDAALVAFLCTAGDFALLGIGAPFWGLLAGIGIYLLMRQPDAQ
jgi:benzoate membrane transport protein